MNQHLKISSFQMIAIILNFLIGSSIAIGFIKQSGNDNWIAILLVCLYGLLLFFFYCKLFYWADSVSFVQVINFALGRYLGSLILYGYIVYFLYISARVVMDIIYVVHSVLLPNKSLWLLSLFFISSIVYSCYIGIESFARTAELFIFIVISFLIFSFLLALINGQFVLNNVQPILEEGWIKLLKSMFPRAFTVPIGEMIACTTLFSYVKQNDNFPFKGLVSIVLLGCILSIGIFIVMGMLGPELFNDFIYPYLEALKKIYIFNVIERLDLIGVIIVMMSGFIKATVYFLSATIILSDLHPKLKKIPILIFFSLFVFCLSVNMSKGFTNFLYIGLVKVPYYLHIPFQIIIPVLVALIILIKMKFFKVGKIRC
ncbi:endospore germination permease [Bacillus sp. AFS017336]|uniref:GerAB/ArcD/ProY family transporter n=1 Tax=Bacillus sp. AFS017336 TaxID=2033489 RepID=UPI000BEF5F4C|nr:endospore germination permease [Bacillus sp. AFS017336]PEK98575.1 hypothetical protein CN601_25240 [Bacillus sp. AFS017336]